MKKIIIATVGMLLLVSIYVFNYNSINKKIARDLGVYIPASLNFQYEDSHGGFLGDGIILAGAKINDKEKDQIIKESDSQWKESPMPEEIRKVVYNRKLNEREEDIDLEKPAIGISELGKGYWIFKDRTPEGQFEHIIRNYSVGIIDLDMDTFYYIKFDS